MCICNEAGCELSFRLLAMACLNFIFCVYAKDSKAGHSPCSKKSARGRQTHALTHTQRERERENDGEGRMPDINNSSEP